MVTWRLYRSRQHATYTLRGQLLTLGECPCRKCKFLNLNCCQIDIDRLIFMYERRGFSPFCYPLLWEILIDLAHADLINTLKPCPLTIHFVCKFCNSKDFPQIQSDNFKRFSRLYLGFFALIWMHFWCWIQIQGQKSKVWKFLTTVWQKVSNMWPVVFPGRLFSSATWKGLKRRQTKQLLHKHWISLLFLLPSVYKCLKSWFYRSIDLMH